VGRETTWFHVPAVPSESHVAPAGHGEAIYQIGVEDDGTVRGITQEQLDASIETLKLMAAEIDADATVIRQRDGLS
jgi:GTPase